MSKALVFGVNWKAVPDGRAALEEDIYLAKISGAETFVKEIPDSVILTRTELEKLLREAFRTGAVRPILGQNETFSEEEFISSTLKIANEK